MVGWKRWWLLAPALVLSTWLACGDDEGGPIVGPATIAASAGGGGQGGGGGGNIIGSGGNVSDVPGCDITEPPSSRGSCVDVSGATDCNPVTNEGCRGGEACDVDGNDGFVCYPPPNAGALCTPCDQETGPFCAGGLTCVGVDFCVKYCCEDDDCGSGACIQSIDGQPYFVQAPNLGVCVPGQTP